jgi:hypothetical protein
MSRQVGFVWCFSPFARQVRVDLAPYVSKTDQTVQTDRRVENQGKFGPTLGRKLTTRHPSPTSGADRSGLMGASSP